MANYVTSTIIFQSNNSLLLGSLFYKIKSVFNYHRGSLDALLRAHGYSDSQIGELSNPRCYISFVDDSVHKENDNSYTVTIGTETPWSFFPDLFKNLLSAKYRDQICFYYLADDSCNVFVSNDAESKYFTEKLYVDWSTGKDCDTELFSTKEDVVSYLADSLPKAHINVSDSIETAQNKAEAAYGGNPEYFLNIYEYAIEEEYVNTAKEVA